MAADGAPSNPHPVLADSAAAGDGDPPGEGPDAGPPDVVAPDSATPGDADAASATPRESEPDGTHDSERGGAAAKKSEPGGAKENRNWIDVSHGTVLRGLNALVLKLDRFFGEQQHAAYEPPSTNIRLKNELHSAEGDPLEARTAISADIRLPAANQALSRFSVLVTGESEPQIEPEDADVDRDPPRFDARLETAGGALELRYDLFRASQTLVDAGAGARFGLPPSPYTRLRLSQGFPLGVSIVGHVSQSVFWDERDGFGETTRLDVHRALGTRTLARWSSIGTVAEASRGYEWTSEIGVQRALGPRTALRGGAAIAGATRAVVDVDRYRIFTRLRRDVYRGWAFLEAEPEVVWPANEVTGERSRVLGIILRLELQFSTQGASSPLAGGGAGEDVPTAAERFPGAPDGA
jgi:hypothetical protein